MEHQNKSGNDERVKMSVSEGTGYVLTRYYLGGRYELDVTLGNTREKLYFCGDAYSAPMVYVRDNNSDWVLYDIVRDWQGSITHLVDESDGTIVAEYSYDPWGRMRDPQTLANMSDLFALFIGDGRQIDINSASIKEDWWGHTSLSTRKNIEVNGNKSEIVETLVSVGPSSTINKTDNLIESLKNSFNISADTGWSTYFGKKGTWTVTLNNVSAKALSNYSARVTTWDILFNSCVGHSTRALWSAGVPVLYLFHPMALNAQLLVRQFGIYSSPYLYSL